MLSGSDLRVVGFLHEWDGEYCRACAVKHLGEATVARLTEGLGSGCPEWEPLLRWEVWEQARENAYEYGADCPDHEVHLHVRTRESGGMVWCSASAQVSCMDCGRVLSEPIPPPDAIPALTAGLAP